MKRQQSGKPIYEAPSVCVLTLLADRAVAVSDYYEKKEDAQEEDDVELGAKPFSRPIWTQEQYDALLKKDIWSEDDE